MIYLLIVIIILLSLTIVVLSVSFRKSQLSHNRTVSALQYQIVQLADARDDKLARLALSEALKEKLRFAREKIDRDLMAMQHDCIDKLAKNNLI